MVVGGLINKDDGEKDKPKIEKINDKSSVDSDYMDKNMQSDSE